MNLPELHAGIYRHYKGPLYQVLGYAHDANDTTRTGVLYLGLGVEGAHDGPRWSVRNAVHGPDAFFDQVHPGDGTACPNPSMCQSDDEHRSRFVFVGFGLDASMISDANQVMAAAITESVTPDAVLAATQPASEIPGADFTDYLDPLTLSDEEIQQEAALETNSLMLLDQGQITPQVHQDLLATFRSTSVQRAVAEQVPLVPTPVYPAEEVSQEEMAAMRQRVQAAQATQTAQVAPAAPPAPGPRTTVDGRVIEDIRQAADLRPDIIPGQPLPARQAAAPVPQAAHPAVPAHQIVPGGRVPVPGAPVAAQPVARCARAQDGIPNSACQKERLHSGPHMQGSYVW